MFDFANRETILYFIVLVSIAAIYYLYREIKRQNEDINNVKAYVSHKLARSPTHEAKKQTEEPEEPEEPEEEENN